MDYPVFPPGFLWGVSAAALRSSEDVALMADLGVGAYRMSIAWPRIQPDGAGKPNAEGLSYYDKLIDEVCAAGIAPAITLYHWDTPQPIEDKGGWLSRDTAYRFAEYATIVGEHFADRAKLWIPLNEPMVMPIHGTSEFLLFVVLPTAHHQNLAHGLAVQALRAAGATGIGTANNHSPVWPEHDTAADREAADWLDALINRTFADPMLLGSYPEQVHPHLPDNFADDLADIAQPLDFYGVNYYEPQGATAPGEGNPLPFELRPIEGYPLTTNDSPIVPHALRELLVSFHERYREHLPPIQITENGCSFADEPAADGSVPDPERIEFLASHLHALREAMEAGVDVRGYFVWSLLDNLEWSNRFGLVHVDYETQRRTPKDSFAWYRKLIR
ncbi:beta-glucosidase [Amycolatopsis sp. AA4]|uniref:glycoside hydrolase family 1 protein n=1 Tax=Actinomycetes TaxID=1760 RepID=UPI0001B545AD|nr:MULTISPECIES: family 1 glycosylhydrolase [Actinomycetes]ATY13003.1 beta-glucosidase [Amycolatopsis sp. AA4]